MPDKKDLKLEKYGVSKYRYRELYNFCLQYEEKKLQRSRLYDAPVSSLTRIGRGSGTADPTSLRAQASIQLSGDISLIENTAAEVDKVIAPYIIKNVTLGIPYEYLGSVPCGRKEFYSLRRNFFLLLDMRKK